jgi:hypothetical protein
MGPIVVGVVDIDASALFHVVSKTWVLFLQCMCAEIVHEYGCSYFWKEIDGKKSGNRVAPLSLALPSMG